MAPKAQSIAKMYYETGRRHLLTKLDAKKRCMIMGATNNPAALDRAFFMPGRFGLVVEMPLPHEDLRLDLLRHYASGFRYAMNVDFQQLASATAGFTQAEVSSIPHRAARKHAVMQDLMSGVHAVFENRKLFDTYFSG